MKGNLKKIAAGGVSIGLAVALLATSLTSHKPVQAVDVFSQTKSLVQPSGSQSFDIVELISQRSSFPTVTFDEENLTVEIQGEAINIGNEELAFMVGGEEPYTKFWKELSNASWLVKDLDESNKINTSKNSLIAALEKAGILDITDYTGHPLRIIMGETINRPEKILNDSFLEVMKYPDDTNNTEIIGYFLPAETFGCYMWDTEEGKMKYVGARMAGEGALHVDYQSGWNASHVEDWESDDFLDDEYESDDTFWDEYENDYGDDYSYDPQYEIHQEESDYTYIENGDATEDRTVEYFYPDEEYTQSTGEVEIPTYQAGLTLGVNLLEGDPEGEPEGEPDAEEPIEGEADRIYNFYSVEEIEREGLSLEQFKDIPVSGDNVGELRTFRYITLANNEWLKSQVFGIEESTEDASIRFANYPIHVFSAVTDDQAQDGDNNHCLKLTDDSLLSRIIVKDSSGKEAFTSSVKLFYIAQLPGSDISKNLRNDILNRVASNTMACIVNDANVYTKFGTEEDGNDTILENLVSYLYQADLADAWDFATADTTPELVDGDRVNVNEEDVAHFVHKNVYAIDGSFVNPGVSLYEVISQGVDEGFDEVAYRIEQENYQREQDSQLYDIPFDRMEGVTRALAIQYILTYTDSDMVFQKASIRVLELQPCYDFTYAPMEYIHPQVTVSGRGQEARIAEFKQDFFGDANAPIDVEIVGMSTSEFCGKIEDINVEYDMIYWGSNIGTFNKCTDPAGNKYTVFNDYDMIGNVYTHIGDVNIQNEGNKISNLLGNNTAASGDKSIMGWSASGTAPLSMFYRNAGNDILSTQVNKLVSFLDAGYPIVVADSFFVQTNGGDKKYSVDNISSSDSTISNTLTIISAGKNSSYIYPESHRTRVTSLIGQSFSDARRKIRGILDTSSYVYQFVKQIVGERDIDSSKYQNFLTVEQATQDTSGKSRFNAALNRPKIQLNMISVPVEYSYSTENVSGVNVISGMNSLAPDINGKYYLEYEFYISNASGMSSAGTTYEARLYVDANMDGKYVKSELMTLSDVMNIDAGTIVSPSSLQIGTHYSIKRELPEAYIGAVPWKLEIVDGANENIKGNIIGLTAVKEEKRDLYICQFVQKRGSAPYTFIGDNTVTGFTKRSDKWTALLHAVPDFNIHIMSVDAEDYFNVSNKKTDEELKKTYNTLSAGTYNPDLSYTPDQVFDPTLESYDMLMFGFTEGFLENQTGDSKYGDYINIGRVMKFIQSDKSVLFTHDTTSAFNTAGNTNEFNILIRDLGGMDRFGVTVGKSNYDGKSEEATEAYNTNKVRRGQLTAPSKEELENTIFSDAMSNYKRDIAFKPGTNQTTMTGETIALTTAGWDSARQSSYFYFLTYDYDGLQVDNSSYGSYGYYTNHGNKYQVAKINSGAITEYPYKLADTIEISRTHGQYYQLDMETDRDGDGEGDMVVWYTIDNYSNALDGYNISHSDVRNNYYIFTKDNITYSGSGDSVVESEDEIKLFINTMIAAYRVGTKAPTVKTVISENILNDSTAATVPYDPDVNSDATQPIYFQIIDANLIADSEKSVFYNAYLRVNSPDGGATNIGTSEAPIYVKEITKDYKVTPDNYTDYTTARQVVNEQVYKMDVPLSLFDTMDVIEIYIKGESEIYKKQEVESKESNYVKYTISKMHLFDMD